MCDVHVMDVVRRQRINSKARKMTPKPIRIKAVAASPLESARIHFYELRSEVISGQRRIANLISLSCNKNRRPSLQAVALRAAGEDELTTGLKE